MAILRSRHGCPWDRQQTHETLRPFLLEETYELLDAIDRGDLDELSGELGDVLFQCVFHAQLGAERRRFDIVDAIESITHKLIRRHPHVFAASGRPLTAAARRRQRKAVSTSKAVVTQWEAIKAKEQGDKQQVPRVLAGVPAALPALLRAHEIGARVAAVGFDWGDAAGVLDKVEEEIRELRAALNESPARIEEEMGDVLFSMANLSRKLGLESETVLRKANNKFTARFDHVEAAIQAEGGDIHTAGTARLEAAWQLVKRQSKTKRSTRRSTATARRVIRGA